MTHAELGAQPPHRPAPPHKPVPQVVVQPREAELGQASLVPLGRPRLLPGSAGSLGGGALPPGRRHPPDLVLVQQAPQGGGRGTQLGGYLLQGPRVGDQPVQQIGPHAGEAKLGDPSGGVLLGVALALTGQPRTTGWLAEMVVGDGTADGRPGVVSRWAASWGMLQPSSSRACRQPRRSAKPSRLACWSS
jgi:hypothetical protein